MLTRFLLTTAWLLVGATYALAQDPVEVDPDHYAVEFENDHVRVLRITYGPNERSTMHEHPASVAVYLTDASVRFHAPDGTSVDVSSKADTHDWAPAGTHEPENLTDQSLELILVELKQPAAAAEESGP